MSAALKQDLEDFMLFCTKRQWQQQHEPIAPVTAKQYTLHLRSALIQPLGTRGHSFDNLRGVLH